jgi:hypothetical protein
MGCGAESGAGAPRSGAAFPPSRAFVVHLSADAVPSALRVLGRVEHIESGRSRRFTSLDELVAFLVEVVEADKSS